MCYDLYHMKSLSILILGGEGKGAVTRKIFFLFFNCVSHYAFKVQPKLFCYCYFGRGPSKGLILLASMHMFSLNIVYLAVSFEAVCFLFSTRCLVHLFVVFSSIVYFVKLFLLVKL